MNTLACTLLLLGQAQAAQADEATLRRGLLQAGSELGTPLLRWHDDRPSRVHGRFPSAEPDAERAVRQLLASLGADLGLQAEDELVLRSQHEGLLGCYLRFQQQRHGLPVFAGELVAHVLPREQGSELRDLRLALVPLPRLDPPAATMDAQQALQRAREATAGGAPYRVPSEAQLGWTEQGQLAWRVRLSPTQPVADWEVLLDASSGQVLRQRDRLRRAEGLGWVFDPNPVASSGDTSLRDEQDANSEALEAQLFEVTLEGLDGSGVLRGDFVDARPYTAAYRANEGDLQFLYDRSDDHFEEVMAYHHLHLAQAWIQSLGFDDANNRQQVVIVDYTSQDSSFYSPSDLSMNLGTGGVDDGEDAEILWHEYGHAVQDDQVPGFGVDYESEALGEGFGDYLASSLAGAHSAQVSDPYCIADWDAMFYDTGDPPCLRRADSLKHYPEGISEWDDPHADGEIWSAGLFAAWEELGHEVMDTLVIEAQFSFAQNESYLTGIEAIEDADDNLYGGEHVETLRRHFIQQGLSRHISDPAEDMIFVETVKADLASPQVMGAYTDYLDDAQTFTAEGADGLQLRFAWIDTELDDSCLEGACDNIYLTGGDGRLYQILNGSHEDLLSVAIPGDSVTIRLLSDYSVGAGGYQLESVDLLESLDQGDSGDTGLDGGQADGGAEESSGGCGCGVAAPSSRSLWGAMGLLLGLGWLRRRGGLERLEGESG